jgi:hypothetical protein
MQLIILIIMAALGGCATNGYHKLTYNKVDVTYEQELQDLAQCKYEATSRTQTPSPDMQSIIGQGLDMGFRRNELMQLCMQAKGYQLK